ncbi:ATP-binding protein [Thalassotalea eurytherma]|uniref:Serine/threonine protein kinase n=1 Tax=Thalassotalea eurytherma TaxID=1144278 RepID=A0ABQ6H7F3_9GAMM|nr:ATP-binding protein [Thalassotalea eurytherma]GLX83404.1 serine/threonine protein kinase [Thalassotalea eurytherma]
MDKNYLNQVDDIPIKCTQDIVISRQKGRELARKSGFSVSEQTRFATAISEITRNVLTYATEGDCYLFEKTLDGYHMVIAQIVDHGPGIDNPKLAMNDGYSTGNGLGLGLPGAKRLVHELNINSMPGKTLVEIIIKGRVYR